MANKASHAIARFFVTDAFRNLWRAMYCTARIVAVEVAGFVGFSARQPPLAGNPVTLLAPTG